jgi:hypothetical protein
MTTLSTVTGAIARSISHNEIVTVRLGSEESMQDAYDALIADSETDYEDHVDVSPTLREVWGWNEGMRDGEMVWRVHLMQAERTGTDRYHE